jgi:hypothetical protein
LNDIYLYFCTEIEQLRPKSPHRPDKNNQNQGSNPNISTPMRNGPPGHINPGMGFNQGIPMMQGGVMGPMVGVQAPMPMMMTGGYPHPQGDMMMSMNMGPIGMGINAGGNRNMMRGGTGLPAAMGVGGMNIVGGGNHAPLNIPQNVPIRLGGGPMQAMPTMQAPMNGGLAMMPNRNRGGAPMMGIGGQPMNTAMMNPGMQGMMGMPGMVGQQMQMGNMGMGVNMPGVQGGMMFGNGPNGNRGWQQGGNPPGGNWNGGNNF